MTVYPSMKMYPAASAVTGYHILAQPKAMYRHHLLQSKPSELLAQRAMYAELLLLARH